MNEPFDFGKKTGEPIAYVRAVQVADLPTEVRVHAGDLDVIWAVHDAKGERLALVADRRLAFHLARQHHLAPVSVH